MSKSKNQSKSMEKTPVNQDSQSSEEQLAQQAAGLQQEETPVVQEQAPAQAAAEPVVETTAEPAAQEPVAEPAPAAVQEAPAVQHVKAGQLIRTECKHTDKWATYTDGKGGMEEKMVEANSKDCTAKPARKSILSRLQPGVAAINSGERLKKREAALADMAQKHKGVDLATDTLVYELTAYVNAMGKGRPVEEQAAAGHQAKLFSLLRRVVNNPAQFKEHWQIVVDLARELKEDAFAADAVFRAWANVPLNPESLRCFSSLLNLVTLEAGTVNIQEAARQVDIERAVAFADINEDGKTALVQRFARKDGGPRGGFSGGR